MLEQTIEEWPFLEQDVLQPSRRVCLTCHWFRHHSVPQCIPLLTCQLHQGLIAHGEHLTRRCPGWTEDQMRRSGWASEAVGAAGAATAVAVGRRSRQKRPG